ncbi:C39 family peptidase, partial [bacterium]|nr:C39 family peptidase [bacterium]
MKIRFKILSLLLALAWTAIFINSAYAERKVLTNVPYIHQVLDMDQSEFIGHNACGPTSAVMISQFCNTQPDDQSSTYAGWYVWNSYKNGFTDMSGKNYSNIKRTMDMNINKQHIHEIRNGAHGYIIDKYHDRYGNLCWGTILDDLEIYLENHGLKIKESDQNYFETIKNNIDAGLPLIGHSLMLAAKYPHFLVIVGYDTGINGDRQDVVVNDPYGNANIDWLDINTGEKEVTYPLDGYGDPSNERIIVDYAITVHPVGIYDHSPGWIKNGNSKPQSQFVVDAYNPFSFTLGSPYDNGGTPFVHALPRDSWLPDLYGQDFENGMIVINEDEQKGYVIRGAFSWLYRGGEWTNPGSSGSMDTIWGPNDLGAPRSNEVFEYFTNEFGEQVVIRQYFEHGRLTYLLNGQTTDNGIINIALLPLGLYPPDDAIEVPAETDDGYEYISGGDIPLDLTGFGGGGNPDYDFNRSTTCKGVQSNSPYDTIDETTSFYNTDRYVYSWIELNNVYKSLQVDWKWYNPNNELINQSGYSTSNPADYGWDYWSWYRCYTNFFIANVYDYGQWHVNIFVDGEKIITNYFTIEANLGEITNFTAETVSQSQIDLEWNAVAGASGYKIYRNNELLTIIGGQNYSDTGLASGTEYCYQIEVYRGNDLSKFSDYVCATTDSKPAIYVPDDYSTIQDAINSALEGDEIIVRDGTYHENSIAFRSKIITVRSENGPESTIISCNSAKSVIEFYNSGENCVLEGFTITNGNKYCGGGIYFYKSSPEIINCVIKDNQASYGGGMFFYLSSPKISGCVIKNNQTVYYGGAIYSDRSSPEITNCIISGNNAQRYGGGIYGYSSSLTMTNCFITGNYSQYYGGGIFSYKSSHKITNCTVADNRTKYYGGGMYIYGTDSLLNMTNSIIWGNENRYGSNQIVVASGCSAIVTYSDVENGYTGDGNIDFDPMFVDPVSADDAPTSNGDYHLTPYSPCVDEGSSDSNFDLPESDIDGDSRPIDGNGDNVAEYDIGADEIENSG